MFTEYEVRGIRMHGTLERACVSTHTHSHTPRGGQREMFIYAYCMLIPKQLISICVQKFVQTSS